MKRNKKTVKIYAEWTLYGEFHNAFFDSWDEFHAAMFNPDIDLLVLQDVSR